MSHEVETAAYAEVPAWHGIGTVVDHAMSVKEALMLSGLDWPVDLVPTFDRVPIVINGEVAYEFEEVEEFLFTKRRTDGARLGVVSPNYKVVQNAEALAFVDELVGTGTKFEAAGSLMGGRKIWLLARLPQEFFIAGDKYVPYVVFLNGHDGKHGVKVALTPTRVVCQNTLQLALQTTKRMWETHHTGNIQAKLEEAKFVLTQADNYIAHMQGFADAWIASNVYEDEIRKIVEELFPYPVDGTQRAMDNMDELRQTFWGIYMGKKDLGKFRGTKWGVYNAVADMVSHWEPRRKVANYKRFKENNFGKVVEGHRLMQRVQYLLQEVKA